MSGLRNNDVEVIGNKIIGNYFQGVFPCDVNPNIYLGEFCMIFNLSTHDETGTHFVAIASLPQNILYFDSFGLPCNNIYIKSYLNKLNKPILFNNRQIQHEKSIFCSLFCLHFLCICFVNKKTLHYYQHLFPIHSINNDKKVVKLLVNFIKNKQKNKKN
jgi:hypothetical protein